MAPNKLAALTQSQRDRLAFIDLRLRYCGELRRQELAARFGIRAAAATRDIAEYKSLIPKNLEYDSKSKVYIRGARFWPLFDFPVDRVLTWLSRGYADGEPVPRKPVVPHEGTRLSGNVDLELVSVLTRAIHHGCAAEVYYRAMSSGLTTREIVPFALADSGLRWHVRAFDRRTSEFRDFVLARLTDARLLSGSVKDNELSREDIEWNRVTELEFVPHPANVQHPDTIESEYGMNGGVLKVRVRAALAGYLLRRWNVDCTSDHSLKGGEYQLWLRNRQALYGVSNLKLAPGYPESGEDR